MATFIPPAYASARMTPGERRFAGRLKALLEDDYLVWYDVPVGPARAHPDFVILHPRRGLLVIEVKDWKLAAIRSMDKASFALATDAGVKHVANPLEQARQYAHRVKEVLERDPALVAPAGSRYQGRLAMPWGYGAVLAGITRRQLEGAGEAGELEAVLPPERVLCQDDLADSVGAEAFQERLWGMFGIVFPCLLTLPQVDRVRWHLFPEIRVKQGALPLEEKPETLCATVPDLVRVMDLQQESLARALGEGHRVIHGVAGSGKTMILGYRFRQLAGLLGKPILVLCYNAALAQRLHHAVAVQALEDRVAARTFHGWCQEQLRLYHVPPPQAEGAGYFPALVEAVIRAVERGAIPRAQYGAILIDEGHDFEPAWLRLAAQMVDPQTHSLLVLYDDAQNLYGKTRRPRFSFAEAGIQARGRTTILRLNYRNTQEVLAVAYEFAREVLSPEEAEEDGIPLLSPQSAGRRGRVPELVRLPSFEAEAEYVVKAVRAFHAQGTAWKDLGILYRARFMGEKLAARLAAAEIPLDWAGESRGRTRFRPALDAVRLMTMHGAKGLEFPIVFIPGLGYMPHANEDAAAEARLVYVAMTRAAERLVFTCHRESTFVAKVDAALRAAAA